MIRNLYVPLVFYGCASLLFIITTLLFIGRALIIVLIGQWLFSTGFKLFWIQPLCECHHMNTSWVKVLLGDIHSTNRFLFKFSVDILWQVFCTELYSSITSLFHYVIWHLLHPWLKTFSLLLLSYQDNRVKIYSKMFWSSLHWLLYEEL